MSEARCSLGVFTALGYREPLTRPGIVHGEDALLRVARVSRYEALPEPSCAESGHFNLRAQCIELFAEVLVAAIDELNSLNRGTPFSGKRCDQV